MRFPGSFPLMDTTIPRDGGSMFDIINDLDRQVTASYQPKASSLPESQSTYDILSALDAMVNGTTLPELTVARPEQPPTVGIPQVAAAPVSPPELYGMEPIAAPRVTPPPEERSQSFGESSIPESEVTNLNFGGNVSEKRARQQEHDSNARVMQMLFPGKPQGYKPDKETFRDALQSFPVDIANDLLDKSEVSGGLVGMVLVKAGYPFNIEKGDDEKTRRVKELFAKDEDAAKRLTHMATVAANLKSAPSFAGDSILRETGQGVALMYNEVQGVMARALGGDKAAERVYEKSQVMEEVAELVRQGDAC